MVLDAEFRRDFERLDVWRFPIGADPSRGESFTVFFQMFRRSGTASDSGIARALFRLRFALGKLFRWDSGGPETVWVRDEEALVRISNRTIDGLLHLAWVDGAPGRKDVELTIWVRPVSWISRPYLAVIKPFRYRIIYPAWIRTICRRWEQERPTRADAPKSSVSPP